MSSVKYMLLFWAKDPAMSFKDNASLSLLLTMVFLRPISISSEDHILMVGDAPGDLQAALENGVYFYPILVRHEAESWSEFAELGLKKFLSDDYREYGNRKMDEFRANLA